MTDEQINKIWRDLQNRYWESNEEMHIRFARALLAASAPNPSAEPVVNGKILNAPDRIYLVCGDLEDIDDPVLFRNLDEVTWCEDKINETDIEYVRANAAPPAQSAEVDSILRKMKPPRLLNDDGTLAQSAEQDRIDAELFQRLLHARSELGRTISDPMWPDHGEVTKAALKRWHGTIDEVIKGASK